MRKRAERCPVHEVTLKRTPILYGLILPSPALQRSLKRGEIVLGGCMPGEYGSFGYLCPEDNDWYMLKNGRLTKPDSMGLLE